MAFGLDSLWDFTTDIVGNTFNTVGSFFADEGESPGEGLFNAVKSATKDTFGFGSSSGGRSVSSGGGSRVNSLYSQGINTKYFRDVTGYQTPAGAASPRPLRSVSIEEFNEIWARKMDIYARVRRTMG